MNYVIFQIFNVLKKEVWRKKKLFIFLYVLTSIVFLAIGWMAPRIYTSSSTILVDEQNILRPLMEGSAITTSAVDRARIAEDLIYSRKSMQVILDKAGWMESNPTALEQEMIIDDLMSQTSIQTIGKNLFQITYRDTLAQRAFDTTKLYTDIFISSSLGAKQKESSDAYDFISQQANEYHQNLKSLEISAKEFRANNVDARPGMQSEVNDRIADLRRLSERTKTQMQEALIQKNVLESQLSGEAAVSENLKKEEENLQRLTDLKEQLSILRLSFQDAYPDIVRIKSQIADINTIIEQEQRNRDSQRTRTVGKIVRGSNNPLYLELRSKLSVIKTNIATYRARLRDTDKSLAEAEKRIIKINEVETKLSELNRDYEVNQDIYQLLLKQREKARISMNIDAENRGLTIRVQEPPSLPLAPKGLPFVYVLFAGVIFSFSVPLGVIFALTLVDGKVRDERLITDTLGMVPIANVGYIKTPSEAKTNKWVAASMMAVIMSCWFGYAYAAHIKI